MKFLKQTFLIVGLLLFFQTKIFADGIIIPNPMPNYPYPPVSYFKIKYHHVDVNIDNQVAKVEISQVFENETNFAVEGTYIFPMPETAAISDFTLIAGGKEIKGRILDKNEAAQYYQQIVAKRKDPALLEYIGLNAFQAKIYPIPANGEIKVEIKYSQILKKKNNLVEFIYPLNTEKFSTENLEDVSVRVLINSNFPIGNIYSPTHLIAKTSYNDKKVGLSYEDKNIKPDKNFIIYYSEKNKDMNINLLTYNDYGDNYFMLLLSPELEKLTKENIISKRVIFVFDTSGSMAGDKIEQAKNALKFCINSLSEKDEFNIIDFHSEVNKFSASLISADTENKNKALKYVNNLFASGGTDINNSLQTALSFKENKNKPTYIIFLTDGLPTVGEVETNTILKNIKTANKNARLFVFGVGYDVNTVLLDKLAEQNKGDREYVKENENIEEKVSTFFKEIQTPALTDLNIKVSNVNVKEIYPRTIPDLFYGGQITLLGRYSGNGDSTVTIDGKQGDKEKSYICKTNFSKNNQKYDFIANLWAARKIGSLLDDIRLHGENKEIVEEIISLSKKFGIITPYTSFLADEETPIAMDKKDEYEKFKVYAPKSESGEEAVDMSLAGASAQKSTTISKGYGLPSGDGTGGLKNGIASNSDDKDVIQNIKTIGNLTFMKKNNVWMQSNYQNEKTEKVKFGSDKYFELVRSSTDISKILSIGDKVIFKYNDKWYEIN